MANLIPNLIKKIELFRDQKDAGLEITMSAPSEAYIHAPVFLNSPILRTTKDALLKVLEEALTNLYGIVGGALLIDLIDFKMETGIATLRCRKSDEQLIWAAAAFVSKFNDVPCQLKVLEISPDLVPHVELDE